MTLVEVFADLTCPFTHVGLREIVRELDSSTDIVVRAWPLEWVNGAPLDASSVQVKIDALRTQLDLDAFRGFAPEQWPRTTVPALNLVAAAYAEGSEVGLEVSLALRDALFERGRDISNPAVLAELAAERDLPAPATSPSQQVSDDYREGLRRNVTGSPDFWLGGEEFFCPSLDLDHDPMGDLTASFDTSGLARFISRIRTFETLQGDDR